ncbi:LR74B-like protein [Mya arenaria]|uniref:LR74B-like protein n=1 Tax=Mya arenaria TaxID=6604 RepID=A0ABY7DM15_MYAAR|nr:LR74B-like protein [Mya arenaria]
MAASTDIETVSGSKKFDIWELIKRANTTDPYILMAKHRMNKSVTRRSRTGGRVVGRRRRRTSTTADSFGNESRMSHTDTEIDEEEDFDYDAEEEVHHDTNLEHCQEMYARACRQYGVHPVACFNEALKKDKCILRHRQMTPNEIKALAVALVVNSSVETLDLGDNDIGQKGAEYIADMLRENNFIKHINLEDNNLGAAGVKHMVMVSVSDTLNLKHLSVAHNQLRMVGGEVIGEALVWNDTMETLDLSWNNLRRDGAVLVAEGLAENTCLKKLNLAWNGFYLDGCRALSRALEDNKTLIELDLTCNRISKECLEKLLGGLKKNSTLEILRLGWNPLTPAGAMIMLEFIRDTKTSAIKELDLTVLGTDKRGDDDDEKQLMDENPIIVLMEFGKLMGFRLMDLFSALDKDGSKSLDHQEIRSGLRMVNIPLSDKCIEILINKLDVDGDGEIDFGELMAAQTEHRKKMSKFYAAQESDIDIEDTDIGRVRIKLSRLMAKKMSGNPAFKRSVQMMQDLLEKGGEQRLAQNLSAAMQNLKSAVGLRPSSADKTVNLTEKLKKWKPMAV